MDKNTNLNITVRWILFLIGPDNPMYSVRLGLQTNSTIVKSIGDFTIIDCVDVRDGAAKAMQLVEELGVVLDEKFTLVYPMFKGSTPEKETMIIDTAWAINEVAMENDWLFSRVIPNPLF
ncbi:MAG: hypothetical protein GY810_20200 [Aureispira sp.]|nr:hypothetical protein [Aureispira sp.]